MLCQQKLAERLRGAVEYLIVSSSTYCNIFTDMTVDGKNADFSMLMG